MSSKQELENIYFASGYVHPELAEATAEEMGIEVGGVERKEFPNSERYVRYEDSVRGKHVFIMQTHARTSEGSINDAIQEQLLLIDSARSSSAAEITAICPYLGYSRQDRKARGREPISVRTVIDQLDSVGADRIVAIDLHSPQIQAVFRGPFDHLTAQPLLRQRVREMIAFEPEGDTVVIAPDSGAAKRADTHAEELGLETVFMTKKRDKQDPSKITRKANVSEVAGRACVMFDDMFDTAGTICSAAESLADAGAKKVYIAGTHGIFSEPAFERLNESPIDKVIITNTLPMVDAREALGEKLTVVSVAPMIGRAILEIVKGGSISRIFADQNHM